MSKSKYVGLSIAFLAIAVFVSSSLVVTLRAAYAGNGQSLTQTISLLQRA